jgi:hypothetical protein
MKGRPAMRPILGLSPTPSLTPLVILLATTVATTASGQSQSEATADALFRSGKEAVARGDLAKGCAELAESQRLDPAIGTLLNLGDCEEKANRLSTAMGHFQAARDQMPPNDPRIPFADGSLERLAARVPHLVVRVKDAASSSGIRLKLDDVELGPASLGVPLPLDPGRHTCALVVTGRAESRRDIVIREGETQTLELAPGPANAAEAPTPPAVPTTHEGASSMRTLGWVVGAVGLVGVGVGAVTGAMTISAANTYKDQCKNGGCTPQGLDAASTGRVTQWVSPISLAVGVAGLGLSSYLLLRPEPTRSVAIAPEIGPASAGLSLVGGF